MSVTIGTAPSTTILNQSYLVQNLGLSASVATNALTVNLKQSDGATDPTTAPSGLVKLGFRNSTSATGAYSLISVTSALSLTVPSGATLGQTSGVNQYVWVYALNNAGTVELAVSGVKVFDDYSIQSTTTIGAGSTSGSTLYSTTGRSNVPIRLIGRLLVNEAAAGTWASAPTEASLVSGRQPITVTDWTSYTPTGGLTNATYTGMWRRIGDTMEVMVKASFTGTPTGTSLTFTIPSGFTIDTTKLNSAYAPQILGSGNLFSNTSTAYISWPAYANTTTIEAKAVVSATPTTYTPVTPTVPFTIASTSIASENFLIPIVGWSVNGP